MRNRKKKERREMNRAWGTYRTSSSGATKPVTGEMRRRRGLKKKQWRNKDWKFPSLMKNMNIYIQESQQTPRRINSKRSKLQHIIFKVSKPKTKNKFWKHLETSNLTQTKEPSIRLTIDVASENTWRSGGTENNVFKVWKGKKKSVNQEF